MSKYILLRSLGLFFLLFCVMSVGYAELPCKSNSDVKLNGAKLWADNCARCHNYRAPSEFTPNQWNTIMLHMRIQAGITGQEARAILEYLTQASLSVYNASLSREESTNTIKQKKSTKGKNKPSSVSGRKIYQETCVACHGANGRGAIQGAPDFTNKNGVLSKPTSVLLKNIKNGIGAMPPKGGNSALDDNDLRAVLNYIRNVF